MAIKTDVQATAIQIDYYYRGKKGFSPAVKRYLVQTGQWNGDIGAPKYWFPHFMPHTTARSRGR